MFWNARILPSSRGPPLSFLDIWNWNSRLEGDRERERERESETDRQIDREREKIMNDNVHWKFVCSGVPESFHLPEVPR